jgi:hypothetical protein
MKDKLQAGKNTCEHISDKELISKICKELKKFTIKKDKLVRSGQGILTDHSPRTRYRWQRAHVKMPRVFCQKRIEN